MMNKKIQGVCEIKRLPLKTVSELYATPEEQTPFIVEGLLPDCGLSILAGKPKAGKSTLARQLAVAVAQGEPFLDRATRKGKVVYLALEEKLTEIKSHFSDLGLSDSEDVLTYCDPAPKESMQVLEETVKSLSDVRLVIIDPIFKFVRVKDGNDYMKVNEAIEPLLTLARKYKFHILTVHHKKKHVSETSWADDVLGSTAISAAVDTIIGLDAQNGVRTLRSSQRYGTNLEETLLKWDPDKRELSLDVSREEADRRKIEDTRDRIAGDIAMFVGSHHGSTQEAIFHNVRGRIATIKKVFHQLVSDGLIKESGSGNKGEPFRYFPLEAEDEGCKTHHDEEVLLEV